MQLRHLQTLLQAAEPTGPNKITAVCWAPNSKKLAVAGTDRVVTLFDDMGERRDKFSTKPADKGPKNYIVRAMAFSPDSSKLAIAQSDNIVFVYKLGVDWGDKKSICNKFLQSSPITCLCWPVNQPNELVYGLAEGKVKIGQLRSNKPATLYSTDSYVTAVASNVEGNAIVSAHLDGSIYRFIFEESSSGPSHALFAHHPSVPFAIAWGHAVLVAGNDNQVIMYDQYGGVERTFDYANDSRCKEFSSACFNPTGEVAVVGNFNSFYVFSLDPRSGGWEETAIKEVENMYTVSALSWKPDGSRLVVGSVCGVLDVYDCCIRRCRYKGKFEFTYVSLSQVIVKRLSTGTRNMIKSQFGCEISRINIFQDRFVVAHTSETLLLGDLETFKLSEVQWHGSGEEKFVFDNPAVCLIHYAGELSLVEYGLNEVLGSVRTDHISGHLLSVRINEKPLRRQVGEEVHRGADGSFENKKIAYLLDAQTICVKDLVTHASSTINHDSKVDFVELNGRANLLLFRDKRRQLHLFDLETQTRSTLLAYCTYVQWVPDSDVVVAQNRNNLCVWYNSHAPDQVTVHQIKGDIEEIERGNGRTEVVVDEGISAASYLLDEAPIEFGTAIDDGNYTRAMEILESLEVTPEAEAMWEQLGDVALATGDLRIAERCAAALGDVSRSRYLHRVNKTAERVAASAGGGDGRDHWAVRSKLALLKKDVRLAEDILMSQGRTKETVDMYQMLHRYEDAIAVAATRSYSKQEVEAMKHDFFQRLLETGQEERAAAMKEAEGQFTQAIDLYLNGGMPAKAAHVITTHGIHHPPQLLETVASALSAAGMHEKAGEFYEKMEQTQRAYDSYLKGNAYRRAVELARRFFPSQVVQLQEAWGDHLVSQKQVDMAINHYIEANAHTKAIEAAINSRQWSRALQLVMALDSHAAKPYYRQLGRYYEESKQLEEAERCYVAADDPKAAVEMYTRANRWEVAHKLAMSYMSEREVGLLYINQAQKLEAQGKFKEAEKLYVTVNEADLAINMYKKARKFDAMVRLVAAHRQELVKETHQYLAQQLELEGNFREAEHHYAEAGEWLSAVNMYRSNDQWEEAIRVAKYHGGVNASKRVAYAWALALGGEAGAKLLNKLGLIEPAIDYAIETGAFDHAFELARTCLPKKMPEIHLKHALALEDDERFKEAEDEFVKANKPREAIEMYVHQHDWEAAMRVAEKYDPSAVPDVCVAEARSHADRGDYAKAEELFVVASKPELALAMYQEVRMWPEAIRVAQKHLPHRLAEVNLAYQGSQAQLGKGGGKVDYLSAGRVWEDSKSWNQAIDTYLNAKREVLGNADDLEEIWGRAVSLARSHAKGRYPEVVRDVARRLCEVGRHESAADLLCSADQVEAAVDSAILGACWDKAREVAQGNRALQEKVEDSFQSHLVQSEKADVLAELGHTSAAMDVFAQRGDWDRVWEMAAKERVGSAVLCKFAAMRAKQLLDEFSGGHKKIDEAVRVLLKYGAPPLSAALDLYRDLARRILGRNKKQESETDQAAVVQDLRTLLYTLRSKASGKEAEDEKLLAELEELLMAAHYMSLYYTCSAMDGLGELACKIAVTLLRYSSSVLPTDKAFYLAGSACKLQDHKNLAFILLNRYVDLTEAIQEGDASLIDNSDFAEATQVPFDVVLPAQQYLPDEEAREDVKTWVLSVCMDKSIEQKLPPQAKAQGTIYEGLFGTSLPLCILTGYPIPPRDMLEVNRSRANRRDWNQYVSRIKKCPWTGQAQNPLY